ncbi:glycogen synthase [Luteolibacter marinus]|uniref:glycogen synthase n=1 Tax=Luteolibacter marinus TaxID=2776705 RepID=UPI0018663A81|nr:glycogen/starch synthase [Luteolibacter marinus]
MHAPSSSKPPRVLIVTPEITHLPSALGPGANGIRAKAGGLADATSALVSGLVDIGAEVHVALPNFRRLFRRDHAGRLPDELIHASTHPRDARIHLADDWVFHHLDRVYSHNPHEALHAALVFQREVINQIIPMVQPDIIHCNDWMTGLIPAMARRRGIKSLFTLHNIHSRDATMERMEATGIGAADFWNNFYFLRPPGQYHQCRSTVPVHMLGTGVYAADHITTVSPGFLGELANGHHQGGAFLRGEIAHKLGTGRASGILNAPDPSYDPESDPSLEATFSDRDHTTGKAINKRALQRELGLDEDPDAAVFFWPSRLDPLQKGPQLLCDILHRTVSDYWDRKLQIVVVADGPHQHCLHGIVNHHGLHRRVAVRDFDERLARLAFAGSDFMLMPSLFEPCGLPQMIAPLYGCLPVVHSTGGLRDTVRRLDWDNSLGNGFSFEHPNNHGLRWAIDEAMWFHGAPKETRDREISRVMRQSRSEFDPARFTGGYAEIYERLIGRPLVEPKEPVQESEARSAAKKAIAKPMPARSRPAA